MNKYLIRGNKKLLLSEQEEIIIEVEKVRTYVAHMNDGQWTMDMHREGINSTMHSGDNVMTFSYLGMISCGAVIFAKTSKSTYSD